MLSNTLDWTDVAGKVVDFARTLSNVTIVIDVIDVIDVGGQGEQFARVMDCSAAPTSCACCGATSHS